ncbi:MAG: AAA family ATPase [Clostridiales bacterium]|nr:AAA family ATPase [Clostridiales bacterium]
MKREEMNGNIYIQFAFAMHSCTNASLKTIGEKIIKAIDPYFRDKQKVLFIDALGQNGVLVYIMDSLKYPDKERSVIQQIRSILSNEIYGLSMEKIDIRINYAKMNPTFQPVVGRSIPTQSLESACKFQAGHKAPAKDKHFDKKTSTDEFDYEKLSYNYTAEEPRYTFDQVILPQRVLDQIEKAIGVIQVEHKVFDEWGLRSIIPTASSALSFYGPPGTGKSMAAEAIAAKLGKKILSATYADIESKFHGEGPKMVKAIFMAAERDDAVLFLDESDSLLSKRLTNVSDGSAQAINSMRSQLLISLERFKGIVIFATNLVVNYDKAFLSRLINIEFTMPTAEERKKIWWQHLRTDTVHVPLAEDVNVPMLSKTYEFCGREIKSAVKSACISVALDQRDTVTQEDLITACDITKEETLRVISANDHTDSKVAPMKVEQKDILMEAMQKKLN